MLTLESILKATAQETSYGPPRRTARRLVAQESVDADEKPARVWDDETKSFRPG